MRHFDRVIGEIRCRALSGGLTTNTISSANIKLREFCFTLFLNKNMFNERLV